MKAAAMERREVVVRTAMERITA
jgi:hypothetical protein